MFSKVELPILGILRGITHKHLDSLVSLFSEAGIRFVEVAMNTPGATGLIRELIAKAGDNMMVGAGTVISLQDMNEALDAGARFIVCPSIVDEVVKTSVNRKIPVFPGALTPTEILRAWNMGATMVKLFPSGVYGPGYIRALKAPFNTIRLMAVGGVNEKNISQFFKHGADAVAFGAGIVRPDWLEKERFDLIGNKLNLLIKSYKASIGM